LKHNKLRLSEHDIVSWTYNVRKGIWSWRFDNTTKVITIYYENTLICSFKPISEAKVVIRNKYSAKYDLYTTELTTTRVKP